MTSTTSVPAGSGNWTITAPDSVTVQAPAPGSTAPLQITIDYDPVALLAGQAHGITTIQFTEPPGNAANFGIRFPVQFVIRNELGVAMDGFTLYTANVDSSLPPDTGAAHPAHYAHFHAVEANSFPGQSLTLRTQNFVTPAAFGAVGQTPAPAVIDATGAIADGASVASSSFTLHGTELANHNDDFVVAFFPHLSQAAVDQIVTTARTPTAGDDTLIFTAGADNKHGLDGNDRIFGLGGTDWLVGDAGNDSVDGGLGNDTLDGSAGRDTVVGGDGNDTLWPGNDRDPDTLIGGLGDDAYWTNGPEDLVIEQPNEGRDIVNALRSWTLGPNLEDLTLQAREARRNASAIGNELNNAITGNAGRNRIEGLAGDDTLRGGGGNDTLIGGPGHDSVHGGPGRDRIIATGDGDAIWGDEGADVIQFQSGTPDGASQLFFDSINDFTLGTDRIALGRGWTFQGLLPLNQGRNAGLGFGNGEDTLRVRIPGTYDSVRTWTTSSGHSVRDLFTAPVSV